MSCRNWYLAVMCIFFFFNLSCLVHIWEHLKNPQDDSTNHPYVLFFFFFFKGFSLLNIKLEIFCSVWLLAAHTNSVICWGRHVINFPCSFSCWYFWALEVNDYLPGWTMMTMCSWQNCMFALHKFSFILKGRRAPVASLLNILKGRESFYFLFFWIWSI